MNSQIMSAITRLRTEGESYTNIAKKLDVSVNTIKSFCRRKGICVETGKNKLVCRHCGKRLPKECAENRQYCSDKCRYAWNYKHHILTKNNAVEKRCLCCGKTFLSYESSKRRYCSHDCYIADRYGKRWPHEP